MTYLLIIESQTPLTSHRLTGLELALEAAEEEQQVKLWLTQDATQMLQIGGNPKLDACCAHANIEVFVDDFALDQRGITAPPGPVTPAPISALADHLLDCNAKPIWH
ncbi:MAG: hypothetical protein AAFQ51_08935 [Pseudomonadota bacterium]